MTEKSSCPWQNEIFLFQISNGNSERNFHLLFLYLRTLSLSLFYDLNIFSKYYFGSFAKGKQFFVVESFIISFY